MNCIFNRRQLALGASVLTVFSGLVAGCGSKPDQQATQQPAAAGELTLYSAQHAQTTKALVEGFTKETGIKVNVVSADEATTVAKIEQEGDKSPADVMYAENSPWLAQLDQKGLLVKVSDTALNSVPKTDSAATGNWVGVSARVSGITYDPDKVPADQLPHSVLDLAGPQWKDKIEIAPSETDLWPVISSVLHAKGKDATMAWLNGLKANAGANDNVPSNENLAADINQGNTGLGVLNSYYYYRLKKYLTGHSGQTIIATGDSFEYPLLDGIAANPVLKPRNQLAPNDFSVAELGTGEDAKALLQEAQLL